MNLLPISKALNAERSLSFDKNMFFPNRRRLFRNFESGMMFFRSVTLTDWQSKFSRNNLMTLLKADM